LDGYQHNDDPYVQQSYELNEGNIDGQNFEDNEANNVEEEEVNIEYNVVLKGTAVDMKEKESNKNNHINNTFF
jgi:hypothetical protein